LVNGVAVPAAEGLGDGEVLESAGGKRRKGPPCDLGKQSRVVRLGGRNAVCVDLGNGPDEVLAPVPVHQVADEREDDHDDDGAAGRHVLNGEVSLPPSLADFLEREENDDGAEADAARRAVPDELVIRVGSNMGTKPPTSVEGVSKHRRLC
jgi:hypothetical protein